MSFDINKLKILMNEILNGLKINGSCVEAKIYRHLAYFDIKLDHKHSIIRKLEQSTKEIALYLKSKTVPIVKLIPTKGIVRLHVALKDSCKIYLLNIIHNQKFPEMVFPLLLGEDDSGNKLWMDMSQNPHLLIAGGTGSGKSTLLHTMISNILLLNALKYRNVILFLSDPKRVEFTEYNHPCLNNVVKKIVNSYEDTVSLLVNIEKLMDERYKQMHLKHMRSIEENPNEFPLVMCIIDEVADLILQDKKNGQLQKLLVRIAQKGRAAGIFLTLATQRPSTDVLTGLIKANFPGRIACKTSSRKDSEIILDRSGAEALLGRGDALIQNMKNESTRFQTAYITPEDIIKTYQLLTKGKYN